MEEQKIKERILELINRMDEAKLEQMLKILHEAVNDFDTTDEEK